MTMLSCWSGGLTRWGWQISRWYNLNRLPAREFRRLFQVLKGVKIKLVQPEDDDSATSEMDTSHASLPLDHSETDPLALNHRDPDLKEGELSEHSSSPDSKDQDDILGHDTYLDRGLASDTGAAPGRTSDFKSEEMDTMAQPSEVESYSDRLMEIQDAWYDRSQSCHRYTDACGL